MRAYFRGWDLETIAAAAVLWLFVVGYATSATTDAGDPDEAAPMVAASTE